jgi:hypothetical protein
MDELAQILIAAFGGAFALGLVLREVNAYRQYGWGLWWMLAWPALPFAAGLFVEANAGPRTGLPVAVIIAAGLLIASLWRPGYSPVQTKLAFGLIHWLAIGVICGSALVLLYVLENTLNVIATVQQAWPIILATTAAYGAKRGYDQYLARSIVRERQRLIDVIKECDDELARGTQS